MHKTKLSPRRLSRSLAVQGLYHFQTNPRSVGEIEDFLYTFNPDLYTRANYELLHGLLDNCSVAFDEYLASYREYSARAIAEIQPVEKAILVIAAYELKLALSVPAAVIINEAVELAKLYGGEESFKFVNGLVDKLANVWRSQELNSKP